MKPAAGLRQLLAHVIDYAGLFPPAKLPLDVSIRQFARYRTDAAAWMLGRLSSRQRGWANWSSSSRYSPRDRRSRFGAGTRRRFRRGFPRGITRRPTSDRRVSSASF